MRRAARRDANHGEIVAALRKVGAAVLDLGAVGKGCPDLCVLLAGQITFLEVKDGKRPPSERKLTDAQVEFHQVWPVRVVTSVDEALQAVGMRDGKRMGSAGLG